MNFLARVVSVLFHPLLMATYLFVILAFTLPQALAPLQSSSQLTFIVLIFIVTFALPVLNIGIFKFFGTIRSFTMESRSERTIPFGLIVVIYIAITYLLHSRSGISFDENFMRLMMIIDMLAIVAFVATLFFKVSVHSMGIWGLIGITMSLTKISEVNALFYVSLGLIILAGLVMSARLQLGAHTSREVMWGGIMGLATGIAGMLYLF